MEFDYVIVGGGSAGCVLANRLSADPSNRVLLIEAGGENRSILVDVPKGIGKLVTEPRFTWNYPINQERIAGIPAEETWQRGKGLGGSSAINGMVYTRGQPQDYDDWADIAGSYWNWENMKSAFRAIEDHELGDDGIRGAGGPLRISANSHRYPLAERAIEAGVAMGLPLHRDDLNREDQEGVGYYCYNIRRGVRESAARVFLNPVRHRPNLSVETGVSVDRVLFDGARAIGVEGRRGGTAVRFMARGEVILSAGAVNSPKLLQLSGIGPGALLNANGVAVLHDSPDVGRRIREHLGIQFVFSLRGDRGVNHKLRGPGLFLSALDYFTRRKGILSIGPMEVGAFFKTGPALARPDAQLYVAGLSFSVPEDCSNVAPLLMVDGRPGMTFWGHLLHLTSEGSIEITSADPDAELSISPNWLTTEEDRRAMIGMFRWMRRFANQAPLAQNVALELAPGPSVETDADILEYAFRTALCGTHAVRSCRIGRDSASVVDEALRVRGAENLRIVDCSVMPGPISGNTNGPAMALAWRAADLILGTAA